MTSDEGLASSAYSSSCSSSLTNGIPELWSQAGLCARGGAEEKARGGKVRGSSLAPIGYRFEAGVAIDEARNQTKLEVELSWPCVDDVVRKGVPNWLQSQLEKLASQSQATCKEKQI